VRKKELLERKIGENKSKIGSSLTVCSYCSRGCDGFRHTMSGEI